MASSNLGGGQGHMQQVVQSGEGAQVRKTGQMVVGIDSTFWNHSAFGAAL